ncbi:MAG: thioredoxin domain-containing protein [Deltaproteobacteria bacterium]|nr:thioredoxin domain-containing protein [Deltaproteobacteria bacterium]
MSNELAFASSPYLQQHKDNPVDWKLWSESTLAKAKAENKPIFLSIGYSSCHWCHVMERESFSDSEVAEILRKNFIAIKVDREERPDLDHLYMTALQMMTGQGGWPLNIFLTPDLRPFFGGTYFPPNERYGRPPFKEVLQRLADVFQNQNDLVAKNAHQISGLLVQQGQFFEAKEKLESNILELVLKNLKASVDPVWGGLGGAPKFFHVDGLRFLLRETKRSSDAEILKLVENSLQKMAMGGVYDQIGGGFHRYSTDKEWRVPHFEKMLYDNALLIVLFCEAYEQTQNIFYFRIAEEICGWLKREMTGEDGCFYSAIDADSEHKEGEFYTWTMEELKKLIPEEIQNEFFKDFHIQASGNFESRNIFYLAEMLTEEKQTKYRKVFDQLLEVRNKRVWPLIDRKILTSWNGLMISALAKMAAVAPDQKVQAKEYFDMAKRAADSIWQKNYIATNSLQKTLRHSRFEEHLNSESFLEDYAYYTESLLDIFELNCDARYLDRASEMANLLLKEFYDSTSGGFWSTPAGKKDLLARTKEIHDGAIPSPYHLALSVLNRLFAITGEQKYKDALEKSMKAILGTAEESPGGFHRFALVYDEMLRSGEKSAPHCRVASFA